jgi:hypothetical protein
MKVFTLRNLVGLAALGGAYAYTRKHGGVRNTYDELLRKKDELLQYLQEKRSELEARVAERDRAPAPVEDIATGPNGLYSDIPPLGQR